MHPGTLSAGIENEGYWPCPSRSFWPFWLRILGNLACPCNNSSKIWTRIPNLHQTYILKYSHLVLKMEVIDLDFQSFWPFWLVLAITRLRFELESQICIKYASWDSLRWYWKWGWLTLIFKVIWPFQLKKRHLTSLLYTDLGWPRGVTRPKRVLVYIQPQLW